MADVNPQTHWEQIYGTRSPAERSWWQQQPEQSLRLLRRAGLSSRSRVIDVGGGDSVLVDALLDIGVECVTVLDISRTALEGARARLGERAARVAWLEGDATSKPLHPMAYDIWHDRVTFHFLTDPLQRQGYLAALARALVPGGHVMMATFAPDAPPRCSGLDVVRYGPEDLAAELGSSFELVDRMHHVHATPSGERQPLSYALFRARNLER
ncbi:MAG TPA: class I SAM-dependent methyltransferase [Gemmatimonadaceae bacterium]|nr:class I SAM-dependent methyltransferase [Gemmatimonadaceae bacterium]